MKVNLFYSLPGSADCEYQMDLTAEEATAYDDALAAGTKLADVPVLQDVLAKAAEMIPAYDAENYSTYEAREFSLKAMSDHVMSLLAEKSAAALAAFNLDLDDIKASIASRDAKALAPFGLGEFAAEYDNDMATQDKNEAKVADFLSDFDFDNWIAANTVNFCDVVTTIGYIDIQDFLKEVDPDYAVDYTQCPFYAQLAVRFADDD